MKRQGRTALRRRVPRRAKTPVALASTLLAAALTLSACGNSLESSGGDDSGGDNGGGGASTSASDGSTSGGSTASEQGSSDEGKQTTQTGTLTVWIMDGTNVNQEKYFNKINKAFEKKHPGVNVEVQFVPWTAAHDKFTTSVAGGKGPDVAEMGTTWTPEFAEAGGLADITDMVKSSGLLNKMVPGSLESAKYEGKYYAVPWYAGVRAIAYRKDWFNKLGIDPPKTWDDLVAAGETIKKKMPDVFPFAVAGDYQYELYPFIWNAGGEMVTQEKDGDWEVTIDEPEAVKGIKFFTGLLTEHHFSPKGAATWDATDVVKNFEIGKVAMTPLGQWEMATIYKDKPKLKGKVGTVPFPTPKAGQPSRSFLGGSNLVVWESSDMKKLAFEWIQAVSTPKAQLKWANDTRFFPTLKSVVSKPSWAKGPEMQAFVKQFKNGRVTPTTPEWGAVQGAKVIPNMVQSILTGQSSVDDAVDTAADEIEAKFSSGG